MNDLSNKEIAEILNTNEGNVRTLQYRGLQKLKLVLEEQERAALNKLKDNSNETEKESFLRRIFARSS